jgi:glucose-1-phosphate thymidylyltransferase
VINSDNYYPAAALLLLSDVPGSALVGFTREGLLTRSNIAPEKIAAFALATADADGNLAELVEKPDAETAARLGPDAVVSMNCWLCGPAIFDAARSIPKSARGEYEITDAVRAAIASGDPYAVVVSDEGVLDMSARGDIASVAAALGDRAVLL